MQAKRPYRIILTPAQLRWLGYVGLALFVPGGIPVVLVLIARHYGPRLRELPRPRFSRAA